MPGLSNGLIQPRAKRARRRTVQKAARVVCSGTSFETRRRAAPLRLDEVRRSAWELRSKKRNPPAAGFPFYFDSASRAGERAALVAGRSGSELHVRDLAVGRLLPDVPDVIHGRAVALLVEGDVAEDGLEGHARMHGFGDLLRLDRLRLFRRLLDDLDRSVGIERVGLRVKVLRLELGDDLLGRRVLARVRAEGHQRAFDAGAADRGELVIGD